MEEILDTKYLIFIYAYYFEIRKTSQRKNIA